MLIDPTVITGRLRVTIENLFQTANQTIILGRNHPATMHLTGCMVRRLHCCIDDLAEIIKELESKKIDTGCLTLEEALTLEGYQEIRRGLIKSWKFIEFREQAIISRQ
jgi:hypothetical protein